MLQSSEGLAVGSRLRLALMLRVTALVAKDGTVNGRPLGNGGSM